MTQLSQQCARISDGTVCPPPLSKRAVEFHPALASFPGDAIDSAGNVEGTTDLRLIVDQPALYQNAMLASAQNCALFGFIL